MLELQSLAVGAVGPVDLTVARGECVVVTGVSGSGKSRLLRAVADLDPSVGTVRWRGTDRDALPAPAWRRSIGYLPAESGWWADSVRAHFPDRDVAGLLAALDLDPAALGWPVGRLSTGEKQRLALARLLANEPEALLLDEPTSALDEATTARVEALLLSRLEAGTAIVLVSHNRAQAERMAKRHYALSDGRLTETAP